jgi:hypothetical protein
MKKVILASVLAAAAVSSISNANAAAATQTNLCTGASAAGNGTAVTANAATDQNFVKTGFTPKCSANTFVSGEDGGTYYRVGSASSKGKNRFAGSSAGGGVAAAGSCAASGCAAGDATTAMSSTYAPTS